MNPGYTCLVIGVGLLVGAGVSFVWRLRLGWTAARAEAVVVGFDRGASNSSESADYPELRYTDRDGQEHTVVYPEAINWPVLGTSILWVGQKLPVLYDPAKPQQVVINTLLWRWSFPLLLGGTGAGLTVVGAVLLSSG